MVHVDKRVAAEWVAWVHASVVIKGTEIASQIADVGVVCGTLSGSKWSFSESRGLMTYN